MEAPIEHQTKQDHESKERKRTQNTKGTHLLVPSHLVLEVPLQLGCFPLETIESIHFTASVWMDCAGVDVDVVKAVADAALRGRSVAVVVVVCVVVVVVATAATNDDARSVVIVVAAAAASAC